MNQPVNEQENFTVDSLVKGIFNRWKLLVIGVLVGAVCGLVVSSFSSPVYEATAVYSFNIDFARTGLLTDIEEDQALEVAGDIIKSSAILDDTINIARASDIQISQSERDAVFQGERRFNQWLLKVRWKNPSESANLANLWAENVRTLLKNSDIAALKADSLQRHILALESCLQSSTSGLQAQPLCQVSSRNDLLAEMQNSGAELQDWRIKSNGFFPGLNYTWSQEARIPANPSLQSRASLLLSGGLAGLFAAVILSLFLERK
jgi:uncharacterized protein involved in exopolysaccharide biosynthesis